MFIFILPLFAQRQFFSILFETKSRFLRNFFIEQDFFPANTDASTLPYSHRKIHVFYKNYGFNTTQFRGAFYDFTETKIIYCYTDTD